MAQTVDQHTQISLPCTCGGTALNGSTANDLSGGKVYCVPECEFDGAEKANMIQCSHCMNRFHLKCVGLKKQQQYVLMSIMQTDPCPGQKPYMHGVKTHRITTNSV